MIAPPNLPPGVEKHHIVYLEAIHCPLPKFNFEYDATSHWRTEPSQVAERIKNATIVIATLLIVLATGMGWVDKPFCIERGVTVLNCPQSNVEALGEHFLALYFASRRRIPELHYSVSRSREWLEKGSLGKRWTQGPPLSCAKETLGIVGYGHLGKRFEGLAKANGFGKIIISERKGIKNARDGRVTFDELIRTATTIVVCCPMDPSTIDLIAEAELEVMRPEVLIINMARGGIIDEAALAQALKSGRIYGAATDVLETEPGGPGTSPLLPDTLNGEEPVPHLIISPHIAWYAERTIEKLQELLKEGIESFEAGDLDDGEGVKNCVSVYRGKIWK